MLGAGDAEAASLGAALAWAEAGGALGAGLGAVVAAPPHAPTRIAMAAAIAASRRARIIFLVPPCCSARIPCVLTRGMPACRGCGGRARASAPASPRFRRSTGLLSLIH